MRILRNSGNSVIVASGLPPGGCPRGVVTNTRMRFVDDYYGRIVVGKGIAKRLFY